MCFLQIGHAFCFCFVPGHAEKHNLVGGCHVCVKRVLRHLAGNQCPFKDHAAIGDELIRLLACHLSGSRLISPPRIEQVAENIFRRRLHARFLQKRAHPNSLHLVISAFAVEDVSRLSGAFCLAPLRFFATADVGADHVAADSLLLGSGD